MKFLIITMGVGFFFSILSCDQGNEPGANGGGNNSGSADWSIPKEEVFDGGPGKDGIPALENPTMIDAAQVTFLGDDNLIVGVKNGNEVRAYPHSILDWHEIINDKVGTSEVAVIYCPLTGTATVWGRTINGIVTTFGVSGLLFNTNVIPYDRRTNSNWSQMRLDCVNGSLRDEKAETFHAVETTWKTWKAMFPETKVVSTQTGFSRNYGSYPYGDYRTNQSRFLFPYTPVDTRIPNKERVLGVVTQDKTPKAKVYRFESFNGPCVVKHDDFNGAQLVIAGSKENNFLVAFERRAEDGTLLNFSAAAVGQWPAASVLLDNEGNTWNIFGEAVSGPRTGQKLKSVVSFMGYWFSWGAFYPQAEIADPM